MDDMRTMEGLSSECPAVPNTDRTIMKDMVIGGFGCCCCCFESNGGYCRWRMEIRWTELGWLMKTGKFKYTPRRMKVLFDDRSDDIIAVIVDFYDRLQKEEILNGMMTVINVKHYSYASRLHIACHNDTRHCGV